MTNIKKSLKGPQEMTCQLDEDVVVIFNTTSVMILDEGTGEFSIVHLPEDWITQLKDRLGHG